MPRMAYQSEADREREEREHADRMSALRRHNDAKLREWRIQVLERAGFDSELAETLVSWRVDASEAIKLVTAGCPYATAALILMPLDVVPAYERYDAPGI